MDSTLLSVLHGRPGQHGFHVVLVQTQRHHAVVVDVVFVHLVVVVHAVHPEFDVFFEDFVDLQFGDVAGDVAVLALSETEMDRDGQEDQEEPEETVHALADTDREQQSVVGVHAVVEEHVVVDES